LLVDWVIQDQQPFTAIESSGFRAILRYVNPYTVDRLPKSGDTIRNHAIKYFNNSKEILIAAMNKARSRIHLSFDLWTSPNYKALLGIVGHWTAEDLSLKTVLLAMREVQGMHTGNTIGTKIFEVIQEYHIVSLLGYSTTDNASNNDTALTTLAELIQEIYFIEYDVASHRLRCLGHIVNLVVKELLFGSRSRRDMDSVEEDTVNNDLYSGALKKLHAIVRHIRITPQRRYLFYSDQAATLESCPDFMVVADNATRWNSTYKMVERALVLRERLDGYVRLVDEELEDSRLSEEDWTELSQLATLLAPFEKITHTAQGNNQGQGSIVSVLLSMDMLLSRLEEIKENSTTTSSAFRLTVDAAWRKLNKYYSLTDRSPVYVITTILHPCMKMKYFERHWASHPDWIAGALAQMKDYYLQFCDSNPVTEPTPTTLSDIDMWCFGGASKESELEQYLNTPTVTLRVDESMLTFNVVEWYNGNAKEYPILATIAYNLFAIPAMSAEAERVFSR
jgi:hypothetical protein